MHFKLPLKKVIHLKAINRSIQWRYSRALGKWWLEVFHGYLGPCLFFMSNVNMVPLGWDSWNHIGMVVAWRELPANDTSNIIQFRGPITHDMEDGIDNVIDMMTRKRVEAPSG